MEQGWWAAFCRSATDKMWGKQIASEETGQEKSGAE